MTTAASRPTGGPGRGPIGALIAVTAIAVIAPTAVAVGLNETCPAARDLSPSQPTARCGETVSNDQIRLPVARVSAQERAHGHRVQLGARRVDERIKRPFVGSRRPLRTNRRQRVEVVGDGDDPRPERYPLVGKPRRVPGAVEALVMVAHDRGELGISHASDDLDPDVDMALDELELGAREAARLIKHIPGDTDLADVVDIGRDRWDRCASSDARPPRAWPPATSARVSEPT